MVIFDALVGRSDWKGYDGARLVAHQAGATDRVHHVVDVMTRYSEIGALVINTLVAVS